jgi:hypothetical protein
LCENGWVAVGEVGIITLDVEALMQVELQKPRAT